MSHSDWFGHLQGPVGTIRAEDYQLRSPMGGFVSDDERDAAFRSFQFMGAAGEGIAAGCAFTNTSAGLSAFAYLWAEGHFTQLRLAGRGDDPTSFAEDPDVGITELVTGRGSVRMAAEPGGRKTLTVASPDLSMELAFNDDVVDVLRLRTPTGPTGWAYVQKVVAVPASGSATASDTDINFADAGALAHHDYTTGFLRPETWWHWACVAGRLGDGRRLGLNLSCGTNESAYRENGGWIDDQWFELGGALFEFDPDDTEAPWQIWGTDDRFHLTFIAHHGYHAHLDAELMKTNFHQLFGSFAGWLIDNEGNRIDVTGLSGFTESQYLLW